MATSSPPAAAAAGVAAPGVRIRPLAAPEWATYRDLRLRALRDAPDAFGSQYAAEAALHAAQWRSRLEREAGGTTGLPLLALLDAVPCGLAWGMQDAHDAAVVNLYQMWVAPAARRRGIGRQLLDAVPVWAQARQAREVRLGVTIADSPAWRLYQRAGFVVVGAPEPLRPGAAVLAQTLQRCLAPHSSAAAGAAAAAPPARSSTRR